MSAAFSFSHYVPKQYTPSTIFDTKFEDNIPKDVVIGEQRYALNKSECKFVSVGLSYGSAYVPCIKLSGHNNIQVVFDENDWKKFLSHQGTITNYLYYNEIPHVIHEDNFSIDFVEFDCRLIKISKGNNYIFFGYETVCGLWKILPLVKYRIETIKNQQFTNYFKILQRGLQNQTGDIFENALNILKPEDNPNSQNICMILELIHIYPDIFEKQCSVRGQ